MKIPETLQDRLRKRKIIPFVGAGVSMPVRDNATGDYLFPCWRDLLENAAQCLDGDNKIADANLVRSYLNISPPKYLEAASHARDSLGAVWYSLLDKQINIHYGRVDDSSLRLAQSVWELGSRLVITTNYDRVLRWACPEQPDLQELDIESPSEQVTILRDEMKHPTLWHLHGRISKATELILTLESYKRLYPDAGQADHRYKAALHTLRSLLTSHSFLFIGFSLDDAHFGLQLLDIHEIFEGTNGPHFVLAREADRDRIKSLNRHVEVVTFPDFDDLPELVESLGAFAQQAAPPIDSSKPTGGIKGLAESGASYDPRKPYFSVPFRAKGDQVIGREDALQAVRKQLTQGRRTNIGQTAAFRGLGGLGKTQLAVEYAYLYKDDYPKGVYWITADQNIDAQLTDLAEKAGWVAPQSEHKYKLDIAQQRLRTYSDCLIIFDNLEDIEAIKDYLPEPQANPHILVTSRTDHSGFAYIPLDFLSKDLSLRLLIQEAGRDPDSTQEWEAAGYISEALGGLPLALEMAGAYLRHRHVSWKQYRDLLTQNPKAALPSKFAEESLTKHQTDLYSTLKINETVFAEEPHLRDILDLLTWSGSAPMGLSLMCTLLDVKNETELTNALGLGVALRLLQKTKGAESFTIHRLVRQVRREDIPLADRQDWVSSVCQRLGDWFQNKREEFADLPIFEAEIDHLREWQGHALSFDMEHAVRLTWLQGYPPFHRGRYLEAKEWVEKALELFDRTQTHDQQLKAYLLGDLGVTCSDLGYYQKSLSYVESALSIKKQLYGERHSEIARSLKNIGDSHQGLGEYKLALDYYEKSLAMQKEISGEHHVDTCALLGSICVIYNRLREHKLALDYSNQALVIEMKILGEYHPETAKSLSIIGTTHSWLGEYDKALEYSNKGVAVIRTLLGHHPDTAAALNAEGHIHWRKGNYEHARDSFEESLKLCMELLGEHHPNTVRAANNLANTLSALNSRSEALQVLEEVWHNLPKDHIHYELIRTQRQQLLSESVRKGFRQAPSNPAKKKKSKSKKKR